MTDVESRIQADRAPSRNASGFSTRAGIGHRALRGQCIGYWGLLGPTRITLDGTPKDSAVGL